MLPSTEAALPLWTATKRRCSRKVADLASPVDNLMPWPNLMQWPNSFRNGLDLGPMTPDVSKAIGTKKWLGIRLPYEVSFLSSAKAATATALLVALEMYEGAKVSVQVASQTRVCYSSKTRQRYHRAISHLLCKCLMVQI